MKLVLCAALLAVWPLIQLFSTAPADLPPEKILPEQCVLLFQVDGAARHRPAIEETAAWKTFIESGLQQQLLNVVQSVIAREDPASAVAVATIIRHLTEHGLSGSVTVSPDGTTVSPYGVIILHEFAVHKDLLTGIITTAVPSAADRIRTRQHEGRSVEFFAMEPFSTEVVWWAEGSHLVIAAGVNPAGRVTDVISGRSRNASQHPLWSELRSSDRFTVDGVAWIDTKALLDRFGSVPLPGSPGGNPLTVRKLCDVTGIGNLEAVTVRSGHRGKAVWNETTLKTTGPRKGLLKLTDQRPISVDELPPLPPDTTNFAAAAFDFSSAADLMIRTIQSTADAIGTNERRQLDQALVQFEELIGADPRTAFTDGLGDLLCIYNDNAAVIPPTGIGPVVAVSVRNRNKAEATVRRVAELLYYLPSRGRPSVSERTRHGNTLFTFLFSDDDVPVVPAIMISDDWAVFSLVPAAVHLFAARQDGRMARWEMTEEVRTGLSELPDKFTSLSYSDPRPGIRALIDAAPMLIQSARRIIPGGDSLAEKLLQNLPPAEKLTDPLFPNLSVNTVTDDGIHTHARQSLPGLPAGNVAAVAVVPVMVALLLPAVQQAREAARRTVSKNNLKQLGLALHIHHDSHNMFPRGTVENEELEPEKRLSWAAPLLPYLEQEALYRNLDSAAEWDSPKNKRVAQSDLKVFQNPSADRRNRPPGSADYAGISGIGPNSAALPGNDPKAGIFGYDRTVRMRDITDGTSNTLAVTEVSEPGDSFLRGGPSMIRGFSRKPYVNGPDGIGGPSPQGFNALLADGSVRFLSSQVNPQLLEALATKSGGEVVGRIPPVVMDAPVLRTRPVPDADKVTAARAGVAGIEKAAKLRAVQNNGVFAAGTGPEYIRVLTQPLKLQGRVLPRVLAEIPRDPWGNEYQYAYNPKSDLKPRIWSQGPDGRSGGAADADNISNRTR